jgi:hypothetical protein
VFWRILVEELLDSMDLEGFTAKAVSAHKPTLTGHFSTLPGVIITIGPPIPEFPSKQFTPQRISYACSIDFTPSAVHTVSHGGIFPPLGAPPIAKSLGTTITVLGDSVVAPDTKFNLVSRPDWKHNKDTGKVTGLIFDRFGDERFLLLNGEGKEKWFNGKKHAENLLRYAWE